MDSLTQIVLGAAVANAGFSSKINRTKTVLFGALVATLPDLDIYIAKLSGDPLTEIELHRGFSHSLIFFLIISFLISWVFRKKFQEISLKRLFVTTFLILLTHSLLDIFTTWGTQLFWWYPEKFALKSIFVVDVFYTIPLLIGVILGLKKQKVSWAYAGIFISSLYLVWGLAAQSMVQQTAQEHFSENHQETIHKITAKPTFSNSILWNVIIETPNRFYLSDRSLLDNNSMNFHYFPHNHYLIENAKSDRTIQRLIAISEHQYIITQNEKGLVFNDLRFGLLKNEEEHLQFAFSYQLIPTAQGFEAEELPKARRDGVRLLKNIWHRIFFD